MFGDIFRHLHSDLRIAAMCTCDTGGTNFKVTANSSTNRRNV